MVLIRTLTISTTTFERMKGKFCGFWQTVLADHSRSNHELSNLGNPFAVNFLFLNSDKVEIQMYIIMYYTAEVQIGQLDKGHHAFPEVLSSYRHFSVDFINC